MISSGGGGADETERGKKSDVIGVYGLETESDDCGDGGGVVRIGD